jgi:hypothetical protein
MWFVACQFGEPLQEFLIDELRVPLPLHQMVSKIKSDWHFAENLLGDGNIVKSQSISLAVGASINRPRINLLLLTQLLFGDRHSQR